MLRTWIQTGRRFDRMRCVLGYCLMSWLVLASVMLPGRAFAQSAADVATARNLAREGLQALLDKDFDTSAERFSRASKLVDAPTLRLGLARARAGQGRLVEAYELYQTISRETPGPKAPAAFLRAIESARTEGAALEGRLSWITIRVRGQREGQQPKVTLNDAPVSPASLGVRRPVDPGTVRVVAELEGYEPSDETLTVPEGEPNVEVTLRLVELPQPKVRPKPKGDKPSDGKLVSAEPTESGPSPMRWVSYGLMATGGAALLGAGTVGALGLYDWVVLKSNCPNNECPARVADRIPREERWEERGLTALYIGAPAVVVAGAGVALYFLYPEGEAPAESSAAASAMRVRPVIGWGYLGAEGQF